jgi:hypothetical protein
MCFSLQVLFGRNTLLIITPPTNIINKFENWLNEINKKNKAGIKIRIQLCTCWSIWIYRNKTILCSQRPKVSNFLQIIHLGAHWIQIWWFLLIEGQREFIFTGCNLAQDIYSQTNWWFSDRIQDAVSYVTFLSMVDISIIPE